MDIQDARKLATSALDALLKSQPNLITANSVLQSANGGKAVAEFCEGFIESHAKYLVERK